jgi:SAM-dependent methyltransferase
VTQQTWCAERYDKNARFVSDLGMPVVDLLNAQPRERILDLGCGDGVLTRKLHDKGCDVVGIDSSPQLIRAALALNLNVSVEDAYDIDFREEFDAVFSNAVLHWLKDADRVIGNVFRALRPGGRFVAECGGDKCCYTIQTALVEELERRGYDGWTANPWYFPTTEDYGARLTKAGFTIAYIEIIPRPTPLPGDISGFIETFAGSFTAVLPPDERPAYTEAVRERLKPVLCSADGVWIADYTRLRFAAHKPASTRVR